MELADVIELVQRVHPAGDGQSRHELTVAARDVARLRAWCEAVQARVALALEVVSVCPERDLAEASKLSPRSAGRLADRGRAAAEVPGFGAALEDGAITGHHMDVLANALGQVDDGQRAEFADRAAGLVDDAKSSTPEQFRKLLAAERRRMAADHGEEILERQRTARRCRTWIDEEGMWNLHARFDPETGVELAGKLAAQVNTMFSGGKAPAEAPVMPGPRQDYLRALALAELINGNGTRTGSGVPHLVVVFDETTRDEHGQPRVDWGLPVDLPPSAMQRLSRRAKIWPVEIVDGEVLAAMGQLDIGRSDRVANEAQRRVLRALHPTCGVPGCDARFDVCEIHHLLWWRYGGRTDLANLLPLCTRHHGQVHNGELIVIMAPNRHITIEYRQPDSRPNAPPAAHAA